VVLLHSILVVAVADVNQVRTAHILEETLLLVEVILEEEAEKAVRFNQLLEQMGQVLVVAVAEHGNFQTKVAVEVDQELL
jgi:hypothetical protein